MVKKTKNNIEILKLVNKEKFRRRLLISSRILAMLLILSIVYFGYEQSQTNKENHAIMLKYGNEGYCYLCGLKAARTCSCAYLPDILVTSDKESVENFIENIAFQNTAKCENLNNYKLEDLNITF